MKQVTAMMSADGTVYDIPDDEMEAFKADFGDEARPAKVFRAEGTDYTIPEDEVDAFKADFGDAAQPLRRISFADGSHKDMTVGEIAEFLRSDEYRNGEQYAADREQFEKDRKWTDVLSADRTERANNEISDDGFLADYGDGLADSGGTAIGRTLGGALSRFAKFTSWIASNARPMGTEATLSAKEFHPEAPEPDAEDASEPMRNYKNSVGRAVAGQIDKVTDILFPNEQKTDSAVSHAVGKAVGLGTGLAEFALTPTALLAGGHFVEGMEEAYDAAIARGAPPDEAVKLGLMRGAVDGGVTALFKNAPTHRILGALGYKPAPAVAAAIEKAGENGVFGVTKGNVATAVGKQMLANAAISASEMGVLGGLQGFIDDAIMQEAATGKIDWGRCLDTLGEQALEQGAFGAVMGLLPTPIKVREAIKARDKVLSEALKDPMGVAAYAQANPSAGDSLAQAWRKDGKVSRKVAADAGLPEMDEASRNEVGEIIATLNDARVENMKAEHGGVPLDEIQGAALGDAITERVGDDSAMFGKVWNDVVGKLKDARELDDPYRREELVDEAIKRNVTEERAPEKPIEEPTEQQPPRSRAEAPVEAAGERGEVETGKVAPEATESVEGGSGEDLTTDVKDYEPGTVIEMSDGTQYVRMERGHSKWTRVGAEDGEVAADNSIINENMSKGYRVIKEATRRTKSDDFVRDENGRVKYPIEDTRKYISDELAKIGKTRENATREELDEINKKREEIVSRHRSKAMEELPVGEYLINGQFKIRKDKDGGFWFFDNARPRLPNGRLADPKNIWIRVGTDGFVGRSILEGDYKPVEKPSAKPTPEQAAAARKRGKRIKPEDVQKPIEKPTEEKPNETGNGTDEASAEPREGSSGRTAEGEAAKLAEQKRKAEEKAEIERRQNETLNGGMGDANQGKLDLGGEEGVHDLFEPGGILANNDTGHNPLKPKKALPGKNARFGWENGREVEIDPSGTKTEKNPLGQEVVPEEGSVAQSIDAEIAADEALAAKGKGKPQEAPPAPAPGSQGNARLDPGYEPESIGSGVKDPVARQQIVDRFVELFGDKAAIRGPNTQGMKRGAAGHYEPQSGNIRSKDPVSLRTIPHEIGHHIDAAAKRLGIARPPTVRHELIQLGKKLYGNKKPNGGYEGEGFAEMLKYYMQGNIEGLKKEAPEAYKWLTEKFANADPDTMAKLDEMRDMIDRLQNQSGEQAVRAMRVKDPTLGEKVVKGIAKVVDAVKPTQENWTDLGAFISKGMRDSGLYKLMDWQGALKRGDVAAMNDIIENHPVLKYKLYNGKSGAKAYQSLANGLTDLSGTRRYTYGDLGVTTPGHSANEKLPTFREIFGDFTRAELDEFENYAIARVAKELYLDKGLEFGLTSKEVDAYLRKHGGNQKFKEALDRYTHYKHGVLHLLVDAGAMSQQQFEAIVSENPIYVKIARHRESVDRFRDKMLKRRGKAVNQRKGGGQQVEDIFDAGLIDDQRIIQAAFQADILRSLVNLGKKGEAAGGVEAGFSTGANWLREVPNAQGEVKFTSEKLRRQIQHAMEKAGMSESKTTKKNRAKAGLPDSGLPVSDTIFDQLFDSGKDTLSIFKEKPSNGKNGLVSLYDQNGRLHTYELPMNNAEGWAKGLMGFTDAAKPNIIEQWLHIAAAATKSGATILNPVFAMRNIVKDTLHASAVNEFGAYIPGASTIQGIAMDLMNTNAKQIFEAMGLPMGSMLGEARLSSARKANRYLMSKNWFAAQWNKGIKKVIADFVGFSENGSRIKEFKLARDYMLKHGSSEKAADMIAGCNALDITIDFQRGGESAKAINRFIPFFNAGVQGLEQAARSLGILRAKEWQLEQNRGKRAARTVLQGGAYLTSLALLAELYNRADDDRKKKADELKPNEKWNYISFGDVRLPVPYEIGYVFASIPRAVVAELYDGQDGAVAECLNMLRKTIPSLNPRDMALIGPLLNVVMNESWTGSAIVPEHVMRSKQSYDWYDERTTEFSKHLAKAFHKVFGNSKIASPAHLDAFLNGVTGNMYGRILSSIEGESTFDEKRPYTWPVVGTFFRNNATASRVMSDFYERRNDLMRMKGSNEASSVEIDELHDANSVAKDISELRKKASRIRADKSLSTTERNDLIEDTTRKMQKAARKFDTFWKTRRKKK